MENKDATALSAALKTFTGTINWYRHSLFRQFIYTDGVQFLATEVQCHWLIDRIFGLQYEQPAIKTEPFQVWELVVSPDQTATLTCGNGNDETVYSEHISYTDFMLPKVRLFFTDSVLLLPTEY